MSVSDETEGLAWLALETVNEAQAKGSTVRFVVSRDPEVAAEKLGMDPDGIQIQAVEEYLLERGYLPPARAGLTWAHTPSPRWGSTGSMKARQRSQKSPRWPRMRAREGAERRSGEEAQEGAE